MFRVLQVDDSKILDFFTGVALRCHSHFFHTIWGRGGRTGIDFPCLVHRKRYRSDSRKGRRKSESSCPEQWTCFLGRQNIRHLKESWDGIQTSSFTTLLICMPILYHCGRWCIFVACIPSDFWHFSHFHRHHAVSFYRWWRWWRVRPSWRGASKTLRILEV